MILGHPNKLTACERHTHTHTHAQQPPKKQELDKAMKLEAENSQG